MNAARFEEDKFSYIVGSILKLWLRKLLFEESMCLGESL